VINDATLFANDNIGFLITPNAFDIVQYVTKYQTIYESFRQSIIVLADGMPIVWLSKLYRRSLKKRITGSNFFPVLWKQIKERNLKAYFILPNQQMANLFKNEYLNCDYAVPVFFDAADESYISSFIDEHIGAIKSNKPDFIFIGLTIPKQQKIALRLHEELSGKVGFNCMIAILGASYEFYLGLKKRAPLIFQYTGTEWFYRLMLEPRRLWKRYAIGNIQFLYIAVKELLNHKRKKN